MSWIKKNSLLIVLVFVSIFSLELWREQVVYRRAASALEQGSWKLNNGMSREEVKKIMGAPESVWSNDLKEHWYWTARHYQGALWGWLGLNTTKGHYGLNVIFGEHHQVISIDGGVN